MGVRIDAVHLGDVVVVVPDVYEDHRGFFMESFRKDFFSEIGLPGVFVQDNHSRSPRNVVRGLHFQWDPPVAKLMRVTVGTAYLVAVDLRKGSPTQGAWVGIEVSAENRKQLYAPPGFARGFCTLSDRVEVQYKCTSLYNRTCESGILWNDPGIGIEWPVTDPILSERDRDAQTAAQWWERPESDHFRYEGREVRIPD